MSLAAIVFALLTSIGPHIEVGEDGTGRFGTGHGRPDALFASSQGLAVAWTESIPPEIDGSGGNVCHVSGIAEEEPSLGDAGPSDREILREVSSQALCCVDRTVVEPVGRGGFLAVTTCSTSHGFWIWSQTLSADGRPSQLPAPVFPVPGRGQHAPALAPSDRGTLWLAWLEGGQEAGVARAARVDASGALLNGPFDLSDEGDGVVLAEPLRDGLTIVPLADGGLAAAWNEFSGREPKGIHFRLFDVSGNPLTNEIQATPDDHESAESPRMVVVERTGPVVLVWRKRSSDPNASTRIYFRMFSRSGEALSDALPVAVDEPDRSQGLPRLVTDGSQRLLVWYEWSGMQRELAEGWIAIRRWSPEDGPVGLTTRFPATFAPYWPLLEAVPDGSGGAFTLFWHADPGDPSGPRRLAWRRVVVPGAR